MPLPRLVDSASSRPRSFRKTGSVAENFLRGPAGIDPQQQGDQAGDDRGVGFSGKIEAAVAQDCLHPDAALAAGDAVAVVCPVVRERRKLAAHADDELVPLHPVIEQREFFADGLNGGGGGRLFGFDEWVVHAWDVLAAGAGFKASVAEPAAFSRTAPRGISPRKRFGPQPEASSGDIPGRSAYR